MHAVAAALRSSVERTALARRHLSWTAWAVLATLWLRSDLDAGHVAAAVGISKGTLTGIADTLKRRELIERRVDPSDRRRVLLTLTDSGQALVGATAPSVNALEAAVVAALTRQETLVLNTALKKIFEAVARSTE